MAPYRRPAIARSNLARARSPSPPRSNRACRASRARRRATRHHVYATVAALMTFQRVRPRAVPKALTVTQLANVLREAVDREVGRVLVAGEISNLRLAG